MPSEISQRKTNTIWCHLLVESKTTAKQQQQQQQQQKQQKQNRERSDLLLPEVGMGGLEWGELEEVNEKKQTSSYKINKY